jgi:L-amino acid N-acyltransferase YncA
MAGRLWRKNLDEGWGEPSRSFRRLVAADAEQIGSLLFSAFHGTSDANDFTLPRWIAKAEAMIAGRYGHCIFPASFVSEGHGGQLSAVCVATDYKPYGAPVIAVVACLPASRRTGIALDLVQTTLNALRNERFSTACAKISMGNRASERLFAKCGFFAGEIID